MTPEFLTLPSPFYRLDKLSKKWHVDLWIKRDDLIPQCLGGNKVRKNYRILRDSIEKMGVPDVLVTNGGANSNHARVVALLGARIGCSVHLVLHGSERDSDPRGNIFYCSASGATICYVDSSKISEKITEIVDQYELLGRSVLVIPGGGHSSVGADAYADAVDELPFSPDVIVHASGTGGTQAGLLKGVARNKMMTTVIGISVARASAPGRGAIKEILGFDFPEELILFEDEFRFGGYERKSSELLEFLGMVAREEGLPLDSTYTGKAMFGLAKMIANGRIEANGRIVFWHTGGALN